MDWFKRSVQYSLRKDKEKWSNKNGKRGEKLWVFVYHIVLPLLLLIAVSIFNFSKWHLPGAACCVVSIHPSVVFFDLNSSVERYWSIKGWGEKEQKGQWRKCFEIRVRSHSTGIRSSFRSCPWTYTVLSVEIRCNGFMWCQITQHGLKQIRVVCWSFSKRSRCSRH